uniref:CCHC-type domain-containing protein n=1 Tax=Cannabis sativa TaxID=3483 RepID=A0A803NSU6_CANSA
MSQVESSRKLYVVRKGVSKAVLWKASRPERSFGRLTYPSGKKSRGSCSFSRMWFRKASRPLKRSFRRLAIPSRKGFQIVSGTSFQNALQQFGITSITLEEVISPLKSKDLKMKNERISSSNAELNYNKGKNKYKKPYRIRSQSKEPSKGSDNGRGRSPAKDPKDPNNCYHCGKLGQMRRDCYFWKKSSNYKGSSQDSSNQKEDNRFRSYQQYAKNCDGYDSGEVYLVATNFTDDWILYLGCTFYMTNNKHLLSDFRESKGEKFVLGSNQSCQIEGSDAISFKIFDGVVRSLTGVKYVPNLARILISISVLDDLGIVSKIETGTMKLSKCSITIIKGFNSEINHVGNTTNFQTRLDHGSEPQGPDLVQVESTNQNLEDLADYQLTRDRAKRSPKPNQKFNYSAWEEIITYVLTYVAGLDKAEPESYEEALTRIDFKKRL